MHIRIIPDVLLMFGYTLLEILILKKGIYDTERLSARFECSNNPLMGKKRVSISLYNES